MCRVPLWTRIDAPDNHPAAPTVCTVLFISHHSWVIPYYPCLAEQSESHTTKRAGPPLMGTPLVFLSVTVWDNVLGIGLREDYFFLVRRETAHSRRQEPIKAVTRYPIKVLPQLMPNQASRLPPKNPPTIPTRRLTRKPNPEPFINLPARKPANAPTITVNNVPNITISFNIISLITNSLHLYCNKLVFLTICNRCSLRGLHLQASRK